MNRPMSQMPEQFVAELGKGIALVLTALNPLKTPLMTQRGTTDTKGKQLYGEEDIAALMGFSNIQLGSHLQDIRAYFNTSREKYIVVYRQQIFARMKHWSYNHQIPIDTSIYLKVRQSRSSLISNSTQGRESCTFCQHPRGSLSCHARGAQALKPSASAKEKKPSMQRRIRVN